MKLVEDSDAIEWDGSDLILRGTRYRYLAMTKTFHDTQTGKINERWHCVQSVDSPSDSESFWVCEQKGGEFKELFVLRK